MRVVFPLPFSPRRGKDLSFPYIQIYVMISHNSAESLGNVAQGDSGCSVIQSSSSAGFRSQKNHITNLSNT